ncbi:cysteine-rich with EGF-like domain protein 2 isoform X1 [Sitodiplosis mosellana]|uniref:cysteine-rich with EGF-like domain protein 2 isoform X1 n=1 Tax=Sitodiplosis mosellana TaxID=263140 RepID=UPI002444A0F2|nr:cysteine-rich with EGF-like domain protein 2 isoform X1 [Sitodiplosis mosellana]
MRIISGLVVIVCTLPLLIKAQLDPLKVAQRQSSITLPPCKLCRTFVDSFQKAMEKTSRGKHESGDTAWEEQNLNVYAKSEVRFTETADHVCGDVSKSQDQCYSFFEDIEDELSLWFTKKQDENPDLHGYLCIDFKKVCCPSNTYGENCSPCSDCNGNGACKGNGTRKGSGKCSCHAGYTGEFCSNCALDYFESFRDETKLLCSKCHIACEKNTGCTGAGAKGCRVCKKGWTMESEQGCVDVDECAIGTHKCTINEFCVNNDGSFECLKCDRACEGCTGDGPDLCDKCAEGYELRNGMCTDLTSERRLRWETFTRYVTYIGLCIATCLTFKSSTWIASIIGVAVALYISVSEYWLNSHPTQANGPQSLENFFSQQNLS